MKSMGEILENARRRNKQTTFAMQMAATYLLPAAKYVSVPGNVQLCTLSGVCQTDCGYKIGRGLSCVALCGCNEIGRGLSCVALCGCNEIGWELSCVALRG